MYGSYSVCPLRLFSHFTMTTSPGVIVCSLSCVACHGILCVFSCTVSRVLSPPCHYLVFLLGSGPTSSSPADALVADTVGISLLGVGCFYMLIAYCR